MIWLLGALAWGAAEASFFFVVPDILLTLAVLRLGLWRGAALAIAAAFAATLTGAVLWQWAGHDAIAAHAAMLHVPAVGQDLLARVAWEFDHGWPLKLTLGAISGAPYKLYAVEAGARHIALLPFLAVSFCARLLRFLLTIAITAAGRALTIHIRRENWQTPGWAVTWLIVYAVYFTVRARA
jgi:membrane protein YqaA with SNARE-associated domain